MMWKYLMIQCTYTNNLNQAHSGLQLMRTLLPEIYFCLGSWNLCLCESPCMCVCPCMHVYLCMYVCPCMYVWPCIMYVYMCVCSYSMCVIAYVCVCVWYVLACMCSFHACVPLHVYVCACMCVCVCVQPPLRLLIISTHVIMKWSFNICRCIKALSWEGIMCYYPYPLTEMLLLI